MENISLSMDKQKIKICQNGKRNFRKITNTHLIFRKAHQMFDSFGQWNTILSL